MPETNARRLIIAVLVFILLDLSILGINYWLTYQMSEDAVVINLSGRQRMLSQRITKVSLQMALDTNHQQQEPLEKELKLSLNLFFSTLNGFISGGEVIGGDGSHIAIGALRTQKAKDLLKQTQLMLNPLIMEWQSHKNADSFSDDKLTLIREHAIQHNLIILDLMNRLTFELEQDSQHRANLLRIIQTVIFLLALVNFVIIIRFMSQETKHAMILSEHFNSLAMHDALTGLSNRREFDEKMDKHFTFLQHHSDCHFALVMLDLDGFKPVNDTYGHDAGDEVLKIVSERLKTHARMNDTVARLGGDEFALIIVGIETEEDVDKLTHRLLKTIQKPMKLSDNSLVHVSASIGVALYPQIPAKTVEELIEIADVAMYQAKHEGKSKVVFAQS